MKGIRLPGTTVSQMPLKNALRSARRSGLTVLGIATAVILLTMFLGLIDTFAGTVEQVERAFLHRSANRFTVVLSGFSRPDHPQIDRLRQLESEDGRPLVGVLETGLLLPAELRAAGAEAGAALEVALEFVDPASEVWTPTLVAGGLRPPVERTEIPGLVVSRKLADDLGLQVGSQAVLEHPHRMAVVVVRRIETEVVVSGIHDNPVRGLAYVDRGQRPFTGFEDATNLLSVVPAPGVDGDTLRRALFGQPGLASAEPVRQIVDGLDDVIGMLGSVLAVVQVAVIALAFLIAFNATSINVDDRAREIATMFAFGLRPRTVLWLQMGENLLLGLLGAALGLAVGIPLLRGFMAVRMEDMLEEIGLVVGVAPLTLLAIVLLTAGVVAATPLVLSRRLRRIDIASTLRVME
jgi:putative ABC transport system permease protein